MTITVALTADEEQRLLALAKRHGVSPDALVQTAVKQILERGVLTPNDGGPAPEARESHLEELFASFDSVPVGDGVNEAAFHRENWYR